MSWQGITLALAAACANSAIDALRKSGSAHMSSEELVSLVALFDAVISCSFVMGLGGFSKLTFKRPGTFTTALLLSSVLLLLAKLLYQKALQLSPISLTVPYLSFTPAILLATAYVFVGELPSTAGVLGVVVVTSSGYLLSLHGVSAGAQAKKDKADQSPKAAEQCILVSADPEGAGPLLRVAPHKPDPEGAGPLLRVASHKTLLPTSRTACGPVGDKVLVHIDAMRQEPGTLLMLGVAFVWSFTATLDKIGVVASPSLSVYLALQRLAIGVVSLGYILLHARPSLGLVIPHFWLLFSISALEVASVVCFLSSLQYILVSYAVAIKRAGILFSVLVGCFWFKEDVFSRLPYIVGMLFGMLLIVLEPAHLLHSHTR